MEKLGNQFSGAHLGGDEVQLVARSLDPEARQGPWRPTRRHLLQPTPTNYRVVWQVRKDFFALRWGDPAFIREHIALNGQADHAGGFFVGSETYIPALDHFTGARPNPCSGAGPLSGSGCSPAETGACATRRRPMPSSPPSSRAATARQALNSSRPTPWSVKRHCNWRASTTARWDFTLLCRRPAGPAGRDHQIYRRGRADRPAADGPGLCVDQGLRAGSSTARASPAARSRHWPWRTGCARANEAWR